MELYSLIIVLWHWYVFLTFVDNVSGNEFRLFSKHHVLNKLRQKQVFLLLFHLLLWFGYRYSHFDNSIGFLGLRQVHIFLLVRILPHHVRAH